MKQTRGSHQTAFHSIIASEPTVLLGYRVGVNSVKLPRDTYTIACTRTQIVGGCNYDGADVSFQDKVDWISSNLARSMGRRM